jgi:hypothetical protein
MLFEDLNLSSDKFVWIEYHVAEPLLGCKQTKPKFEVSSSNQCKAICIYIFSFFQQYAVFTFFQKSVIFTSVYSIYMCCP